MKKFRVPIFTEEYSVDVVFGDTEELAKYISKTCGGWSYEDALDFCKESRGGAFNLLPQRGPLIVVDSGMPLHKILATLPHEACHAVGYIMDHLDIKDDRGGEFLGHGISSVMRHCTEYILKQKL